VAVEAAKIANTAKALVVTAVPSAMAKATKIVATAIPQQKMSEKPPARMSRNHSVAAAKTVRHPCGMFLSHWDCSKQLNLNDFLVAEGGYGLYSIFWVKS
jgi:hypothetical protein